MEETLIEVEHNLPALQAAEPDLPAQGAEATDARALRRRVLGLAGPIIGENFLETLLGIIDTWLVAGLGAVALAGVGSALQVMFLLIAALSALAVGSAVLVAQAVGAQNMLRAGQLGRQSLLWSVVPGVALSWAHVHLEFGIGYGAYWLPMIQSPLPGSSPIPEGNLYVRF